MLRSVILFIVLLGFSHVTHANVQIDINGSVYSYDSNPRLDQVLAPVADQDDWYWPNAQLFDLSRSAIEAQRNILIQRLINKGTTNNRLSGDYQKLINDIQSWRLADRIQINIDFDLARISLANNPKIENGNYLLTLSKRPEQLHIFGAVAAPRTITYPENTCIDEILTGIMRLDIADNSFVYLISPTGNVEKVPVAYWNKACAVPMPGSSIYIPIQEYQWLKSAALINQQVTSLAVNRIRVP
jgi:hypothetical protein